MEQTYGEVCSSRDLWKDRAERAVDKITSLTFELEAAKTIARAGGLYIGKQEMPNPDERGDLYLFNSPQTRSTLAVWSSDCTHEKVATLMRASNAAFGIRESRIVLDWANLPAGGRTVSAEPPFGAPDSLESHSVESVPE